MSRRFSFLPSFYEALKDLPDETRLEAYDAIVSYGVTGACPEGLSPIANSLLLLTAPVIDKSAKWLAAQEDNGKKGGRPPKNSSGKKPEETQGKPNQNPMETQLNPEKNPSETDLLWSKENGERNQEKGYGRGSGNAPEPDFLFHPPSLEDVIRYCAERKNQVDPHRWYDYYRANGWRVGRNPMQDWKASVRSWESNRVSWRRKQADSSSAVGPDQDDHLLDGIL